jgi:asparagine synthase (glutamine-hydrolysing)
LLGDFTFAVWDERARHLFCARDQLGVKPFFYAHIGRAVIFSNSLNCLRRHPAVSDALNDQAIADFLLFEVNQELSTTVFADIQRLPPAHAAVWDERGFAMHRYWTMPVEEPVFFRHSEEYPERFAELLRGAVSDRLRTSKVSVFMSGGLDSSSLAAVASELLRQRGADCGVQAFTTLLDGLDGNERYYAHLVAAHLQIPINTSDLSDTLLDAGWERAAIRTPEPIGNPTQLGTELAQFRTAAAHARVGFYGEGPDNALVFEWQAYLARLVQTRDARRLVADVCRHIVLHRRVPLLPSVLRMWRARRRRGYWTPAFPSWLAPDFESRLRLRERWEQHTHGSHKSSVHPVRPVSYTGLNNPLWEPLFRAFDAEATGTAFEVRHPFLDLRVLRFCLALPAVPWCRRKLVLRHAMRDRLPLPVLRRDKTPLSSDPNWEGARRFGLAPFDPTPQLAAYVNVRRVPARADADMVAFRTNFRPRALNYWLSTGAPRP